MRPPPSLLLTMVTSLLVTSSSVMVVATHVAILNGCPGGEDGAYCTAPREVPQNPYTKLSCVAQGFTLEQNILQPGGELLGPMPNKLEAACYSKCHPNYQQNQCPVGSPADCKPARHDAAIAKYSCDDTHDLIINGGRVEQTATCDKQGWKDKAGNVVFPFKKAQTFHHITVFCVKKPATATPCVGADSYFCTATSCLDLKFVRNKLECGPGSKLMYGSRLFDHAMCASTGWTGHTTAGSEDLNIVPPAKIPASCFKTCSFEDTCDTTNTPGCTTPTFNAGKLSCTPSNALEVDGSFYKEAECSIDGWKDNKKLLVDLRKNPFAKIEAACQPYSSLFEDDCPKGVKECEQKSPQFASDKLTCSSHANHCLVVGDQMYKELTVDGDGWKTTEAKPKHVLEYKTNIVKLKARCLSKCHTLFVDTTCTGTCNKPIYINAGEPLFCRDADEELFLNDKKVPDVVCDVTAGGWKAADAEPGAPLLLSFTEYTKDDVKAVCKRKPGPIGPIPAPPVINATVHSGQIFSHDSKTATYILVGIIVVLVLVSGGLAVFLWRIRRKQSDDDDDGKSMTKSGSKKESEKKMGGKKGKKNSKNSKGKKGKKVEVNSDVEVPDRQMSDPHSTVPLTAALAGLGASPVGNAIDV